MTMRGVHGGYHCADHLYGVSGGASWFACLPDHCPESSRVAQHRELEMVPAQRFC